MKKILHLVLSLCLCMAFFNAVAQSTGKGISFFTGTFKEAIQQAKKENKKIFFDAYAEWCGPCRFMDSAIYTDPEIGAFFNQHFVSVRVDMEKGEGPELAKKLSSINGYPSLLFIKPGGFAYKTVLGSLTKEILLGEAKLAAIE
ncbi:MAG: thioredoxin family protein [Bacteroidota bacterium]